MLNGQVKSGTTQGRMPLSSSGKITTWIVWGEERELNGLHNM